MRTIDVVTPRSLLTLVAVRLATAVVALALLPAAALAQSTSCGPLGGGGSLHCNPTPVTIAFSMPRRDAAVAVAVTLARGQQQGRNGPPGAPPDMQVRTWDINPTTPRPPTLEEQGYILASEARRQDGSLLV